MPDDTTDVLRDSAAWVAALPEWGNLYGSGRECEHGPVIDHVRRVLGRLDADAVTALALHWRSLAADREAAVAAWNELCTTWNRDMNRSYWRGDGGWEYEAYEPTVRVIEAIGCVLERAGTLGMSRPDPATVRAFARAFELATRGTGQPVVAEFAGSLDVGQDAWSAALTCAAAISVADTLVRPAVLRGMSFRAPRRPIRPRPVRPSAMSTTPEGNRDAASPDPPGRFVWSAPGNGGGVGYALRAAVRTRLGPPTFTGEDFMASFADLDIEEGGAWWLRSKTLYVSPRAGDWTPFEVPADAVVHQIWRIADDATTTRLARGTRLGYRGFYPDQTEGIEGSLFEILDGPFAGTFAYLGTGGRYGDPSWAVEPTLVPGGDPLLDDAARCDEIVALMRATAIEHGAPGLVVDVRCQHDRVVLAWGGSMRGGEDRYCAGDAWEHGWIQNGWPPIEPANEQGAPRRWFGRRSPRRDPDSSRRMFTGEPDPA